MGKFKKTFRTRAQPKNFKINTESKKSQTKKKLQNESYQCIRVTPPKIMEPTQPPKNKKG